MKQIAFTLNFRDFIFKIYYIYMINNIILISGDNLLIIISVPYTKNNYPNKM